MTITTIANDLLNNSKSLDYDTELGRMNPIYLLEEVKRGEVTEENEFFFEGMLYLLMNNIDCANIYISSLEKKEETYLIIFNDKSNPFQNGSCSTFEISMKFNGIKWHASMKS